MAGHGAPPAEVRRRTNAPIRGEWQPSAASGWQHGDIPPCPSRSRLARATWSAWMGSWFAAHWAPEDLPNLLIIIRLWARSAAGTASGAERSEMRQLMDSYGITLKGQQDRRWQAPRADAAPVAQPEGEPATRPSRYEHLRTVAS